MPRILYQNGRFWVTDTGSWYEILEDRVTHSRRVATIGYGPNHGIERAKSECDRRAGGECEMERGRR